MVEKTITVTHKLGLHARPASLFVKTAQAFQSKITIANLTRNTQPGDAKSVLTLLQSAVAHDHTIHLVAEGQDAGKAIDTLSKLIENNFEE